MPYDKVQLLQIGRGSVDEHVVVIVHLLSVSNLVRHLLGEFGFLLEGERDELLANGALVAPRRTGVIQIGLCGNGIEGKYIKHQNILLNLELEDRVCHLLGEFGFLLEGEREELLSNVFILLWMTHCFIVENSNIMV